MPLDYWKDRFQTANPSQYHQFKNKTPEKKDQMATAALYKARQPNNENFVAEDAMMGKIADSGKIIRILKKAHTVPFSDEKNWLLVDTDPGKGNSGLGIKWIPADTRFEWVRPYRDSVDENLSPQTIHKLADHKGVKWDNEPSFLQLTKRLTGKEHLDDLDQAGLNKVKKHLDGLQGVAEEINSDVFNPAFNDTQIFDELTYRATAEKGYNDKTYFQVKVLNSNFQQVGLAKFSPTKRGLVSAMTWVHPEYKGQGLARNIYAYVRSLGNTIAPSRNQLPAGKAMWASWKKSGDAKYLMKDVAEGWK